MLSMETPRDREDPLHYAVKDMSIQQSVERDLTAPIEEKQVEAEQLRDRVAELEAEVARLRGLSFDEFDQAVKDTFVQWPATRETSLEEDPHELIETNGGKHTAKDGFYNSAWTSMTTSMPFIQWPAMQCPPQHSAVPDPTLMQSQGAPTLQNLAAWDMFVATSPQERIASFMPLKWPVSDKPSFEDLMKVKSDGISESRDTGLYDDSDATPSTAASLEDDDLVRELILPAGFSDDESDKDPLFAVAMKLTAQLGIQSIGSAGHDVGNCKPCGFLWKSNGCQKGSKCQYCHLCPPDEIKRRKKEKIAMRKNAQGF